MEKGLEPCEDKKGFTLNHAIDLVELRKTSRRVTSLGNNFRRRSDQGTTSPGLFSWSAHELVGFVGTRCKVTCGGLPVGGFIESTAS